LKRGDEVTDKFFLGLLVVPLVLAVVVVIIVVVVLVHGSFESVDIFTLGSNFVQFTAHFVGLGGVLVVVIVVIAIIVFFLDTRDASVFGVDGLQESMRKLHLVTITILEVVLDILAGINSHTFFISKDTNLDLGSVAAQIGPA
jgi:hypothetical protein